MQPANTEATMAEEERAYDISGGGPGGYPLEQTAALLNDRLGLYLSAEQQRGLAIALLAGVALGAALVTWALGSAVRRGRS